MSVELCSAVKGLVTLGTFIELFPSVNPLVYSEGGTLAEGLPTLPAAVRFLSGVHPQVFDEELLPKAFSHSLHLYGFSPVWVLW